MSEPFFIIFGHMFRSVTLLLLLSLCSCAADQPSGQNKFDPPLIKPGAELSKDTMVIRLRVAVCYYADSIQIEALKKNDSDAFYTAADDMLYYMSIAEDFLDSNHIKILHTHDEKVLMFVKRSGEAVFVRKDTTTPTGGIYFFNGVKDPYNADITNIAREYETYFK